METLIECHRSMRFSLFLHLFCAWLKCLTAQVVTENSCCDIGGRWTRFYNTDRPGGRNKCDCENLNRIRKLNPGEVCESPSLVDGRLLDGTSYHLTGQKITISPRVGLRCYNRGGQKCLNYKVRFCCVNEAPTCNDQDWTPFLNLGPPDALGDLEPLIDLQNSFPTATCHTPTHLEGRVVGQTTLNIQQNVHLNTAEGFKCLNVENAEPCEDYEVRLCCPGYQPEPECTNGFWTEFFNTDTTREDGDLELLSNIQSQFPICDNPTTVEARLEGEFSHWFGGQVVEIGIEFGFRCNNSATQFCYDYEVRFCCPGVIEEIRQCAEAEGHWTRFYNRDNQTGQCDCETLNEIRMEYPGEVCMNPLFADARLYNGLPYHMGGQRVYVSPEDGLRCNNNDTETEGQECYDYQIRFCCKLEPPTCQDHDWSPYFNTDDPSGEGDFEFLFEIQRLYPKAICSSPVWMEARKVNDETMFIDQNVHLNHTQGFQCFIWQNHQSCYDYEVRFCCPGFYPIAECDEKYWTSFFNRDQPDGLGDFETAALIKFDFPEELCKHPTAIQARLTDGRHYLMSNQDIFLNVTEGLICRNDITGGCLDYEVRFCCPKAETPYCPNDAWTPFLDHDDPGLYGDYETLPQLQAIYPELICNKPFAVEARLVNGESYVLGEQDIVLSETGGLRCDNSEDQRCFDYEIRFCCPADNFDPTCPEGVWSGYVSSDDPRGFGDVEEYSEILKIDAEITCIVPYAVQYRTVDPIFRDVKQNVHVEDNRFLCINNDPEGQICVDYEISFCCITVTCVTTITIGPLPCGYTREMCVALGHCWDNKEESCYVF